LFFDVFDICVGVKEDMELVFEFWWANEE